MANPQTSIEDTMASLSAVSEGLNPLVELMLQNAHLRPCRLALAGLDDLAERVNVAHGTTRTLYEKYRWMLEELDVTPAELVRLIVRMKDGSTD